MNTNQGALYFGAGIDLNQWRRDIDSMRRDIVGLNNSVSRETKSIDNSFRNLAGGIAGYFSAQALVGFTQQLISVRGEFQKTEIAFSTMLGSSEKAKALMAQMVDLAAKTPFSLQDVSAGAKQLLAFQVPANEVVDTLTRMGNIAAGLGVPLSRINLVYGQVKAKGKLMGDDLRQFTEAGIPMVAELAKKFNVSTAAITEMVTAGKIGFKDVQDVLFSMTNEGGMFFNLMEKQSKSLSGQIANLGDAFDQMLNKIAESNDGILSGGISELTYLVENYEKVIEVLKGVVLMYGAYRAALITQSAILQVAAAREAGFTVAMMGRLTATSLLNSATKALNATMLANPYAIAAALVVGLTYAIAKMATESTYAEAAQDNLNKKLSEAKGTVSETKAKIESLVIAIKSENTSNEKRQVLLKQIHTLSNGRLNQLTVEAIRTGKATEAINEYIKALDKEAKAKAYVDLKAANYKRIAEIDTRQSSSFGERVESTFQAATYQDKNGNTTIKSVFEGLGKKSEDAIKENEQKEKTALQRQNKALDKEIAKNSDVLADSYEKAGDKIADGVKAVNDKVKKEVEKIYGENTLKGLQQRVDKFRDIMEKSVIGSKNYNNAKSEVEKYQKQIDALTKQQEKKGFDEELTELERQWKAKYKIAEFYGKEIADAQFPALKGSYYDDIKKKYDEFATKFESGVTLSDDEVENWGKLREILNNLTGEKDPLSNFNDSMDRALAKLPSLYDQIEYLQKLRDQQNNDGVSNGFFASADNKLKEKLQEQKAIYQEFLNEAETYESKKLEIERKYEDIRKRIGNNGGLSDAERIRLLNEAGKKENEEVAKLNLDGIKKTQLWVKAFGDLSKVGQKSLSILKKELEEFINSDDFQKLSPSDKESVMNAFNNINSKQNEDVFKNLGNAVSDYTDKVDALKKAEREHGKNSPQYQFALKQTEEAFVGIMQAANAAGKFMTDSVVTILDSFGAISEEGKQTIKDVQTLVDGIVNVVAGYFSTNYAQMISGIVQIVVALASLLSGDVRRAKNIKEWQAQVDSLKQSYEALQYQIEKTAGEASLQGQTQLIANLKQQQELLIQMRNAEAQKKKADAGKIGTYNDQIAAINQQIEQLVDSFKESITTTDFKQMSDDLANALIEAFRKGEDAAGAFDKVVDDVMRNAVANALKIKILQPAVESMVNQLYSSLGFGNKDTTNIQNQIADLENKIVEAQSKMATVSSIDKPRYEAYIKSYQLQIAKLKQQIAEANVSGSFDGLTDAERDEIKAQGQTAMQQYMDALKEYEDLFGSASENAQGLKGDIKGITEKTAGALEAQFNAIRINVVEILKVIKGNQTVSNNHTLLLSQIEFNTRNLIQMRKDLQELNSKTKNQLAGVP